MTTPEIEIALAGSRSGVFSASRYVVLPRARWGLERWGIRHECDLLALSRSGMLHEIEIKISRADLRADAEKRHQHTSSAISRLWYAVPLEMEAYALEQIPAAAGLVRCYPLNRGGWTSSVIRRPTVKRCPSVPPDMVAHIHELIACRYWAERSRGKFEVVAPSGARM